MNGLKYRGDISLESDFNFEIFSGSWVCYKGTIAGNGVFHPNTKKKNRGKILNRMEWPESKLSYLSAEKEACSHTALSVDFGLFWIWANYILYHFLYV